MYKSVQPPNFRKKLQNLVSSSPPSLVCFQNAASAPSPLLFRFAPNAHTPLHAHARPNTVAFHNPSLPHNVHSVPAAYKTVLFSTWLSERSLGLPGLNANAPPPLAGCQVSFASSLFSPCAHISFLKLVSRMPSREHPHWQAGTFRGLGCAPKVDGANNNNKKVFNTSHEPFWQWGVGGGGLQVPSCRSLFF